MAPLVSDPSPRLPSCLAYPHQVGPRVPPAAICSGDFALRHRLPPPISPSRVCHNPHPARSVGIKALRWLSPATYHRSDQPCLIPSVDSGLCLVEFPSGNSQVSSYLVKGSCGQITIPVSGDGPSAVGGIYPHFVGAVGLAPESAAQVFQLSTDVNGAEKLGQCGGEIVYHQGSMASLDVRTNCSGTMSL